MTEIPEHLLQRSRERRAALGLGGGGDATPAAPAAAPAAAPGGQSAVAATAAAPAAVAKATAAEPVVKPPEPLPHYVEASKRRGRIPVWAMPVIAGLFFWVPVYIGTLELPPQEGNPVVDGEKIFAATCAGCHPGGNAGAGRQLNNGEAVKTFPDWRDQVAFIEHGTTAYDGEVYGDPDREGGAHLGRSFGFMPPQSVADGGGLTRLEILQTTLYVRSGFAGGEPLEDSELLAYLEALSESGEDLPDEGDLPDLLGTGE